MTELRDPLLLFLGFTSLQLLLLALLAGVFLKTLRLSGSPARKLLLLVALLPFLWPIAALGLPSEARIALPSEIAPPAPIPAVETPPPVTQTSASEVAITRTHPAARASASTFDWRDAVLGAWGLGIAGLGILVGGAGWRTRRLLARARPARSRRVRALFEACRREVGLRRRVRLLGSNDADVPFVCGPFRPTVVVPETYFEPPRESDLRLVLLHELAHVRRGDLLWVAPETLLRWIYFFHPLLHRVLDRLREERECRCDRDVVRIVGERASYAAFLLRQVHGASPGRRRGAVLALGRHPSALSRRVERICQEEREPTMKSRIGMHAAVWTVATMLALLLALGPARAEESAAAPTVDGINANPTPKTGVYHVKPVFQEVKQVYAFRRGGPYGAAHRRMFASGTEWAYAQATGHLHLKAEVDDAVWMVHVDGVRTMPWTWQAGEPLIEDSVTVELEGRAGVRGTDYEVDAAAGRIWFLKKELCDRKRDYAIKYRLPRDPAHPDRGRGASIISRRSWPPAREAKKPVSASPPPFRFGSVGTTAVATENPRVHVLVRPFGAEDLGVAIAAKGESQGLKWLRRGQEFAYDEQGGVITLLDTVSFDAETQRLFVHGTPLARGTFLFRKRLAEGSVAVILGSRRLAEGKGFTVDYATGTVTVRDPEIQSPKAKFYLKTSERSFGTHGDYALVRRLLKE